MSQLRISPTTLLAAIALLGVGICDPCDVCDPGSRVNAATVSADAGSCSDRGAPAVD